MFACRTGSVLRLLRESLNLSVRDVAKIYQISPSAINAWETGRNKPNETMAEVITSLWEKWLNQEEKIALVESIYHDFKEDEEKSGFSPKDVATVEFLGYLEYCHVKELAISSLENIMNLKIIAGEFLSRHLEFLPAALLAQGRYIKADEILSNIIGRNNTEARKLYLCRLSLAEFEPIKFEIKQENKSLESEVKMVFRHLSDSIDALLVTSHEILLRENYIIFEGYYLGKDEIIEKPPILSFELSFLGFYGHKSIFMFDKK